jgi:hypothetical protein
LFKIESQGQSRSIVKGEKVDLTLVDLLPWRGWKSYFETARNTNESTQTEKPILEIFKLTNIAIKIGFPYSLILNIVLQNKLEGPISNQQSDHSQENASLIIRNIIENPGNLARRINCVGHWMSRVSGIKLEDALQLIDHKLMLEIPILFNHGCSVILEVSGKAFVKPRVFPPLTS